MNGLSREERLIEIVDAVPMRRNEGHRCREAIQIALRLLWARVDEHD
jgi:hypothetical protein